MERRRPISLAPQRCHSRTSVVVLWLEGPFPERWRGDLPPCFRGALHLVRGRTPDMAWRIRRNAVVSLVVSSFLLGATFALTPAATAAPVLGTIAVRAEDNGTRALSSNDREPKPRASMGPRTGDGPLEAVKEGRGIVMRIPLEGGGRLVVKLTPDEADALAEALSNPAEPEQPEQPEQP